MGGEPGLPRGDEGLKAASSQASPSPASHFLCILPVLPSAVGSVGLFRVGLWVTAPIAVLKSLISVVHLITAARNMAALDAADRARKK